MKAIKILAIAAVAAGLAACGSAYGKGPFGSFGKGDWQAKRAEWQNSVVLINTFEVPAGKEDEALAMWQKARDYLAKQDGYIGTALHQNLDPEGRFHFVNIARWRSAEDFNRAIANMRRDLPDNQVAGVKATPSLFKIVERDMPFPPFARKQKP